MVGWALNHDPYVQYSRRKVKVFMSIEPTVPLIVETENVYAKER
jgi:hypothetical protein